MIDKLKEALVLGDKMRIAPEMEYPRVSQTYCDAEGRWWCIGAWACVSEDEAQMPVGRMEPRP